MTTTRPILLSSSLGEPLTQRYPVGMKTKQGRPRRFAFGSADDVVGAELSFFLGFLDELAVRVEDQVVHLPVEALNYTGPNSQLSIGRLVLHLIESDLSMLARAVPGVTAPPYQAQLDKGLLAGFSAPPGDLGFAKDILKEHLVFRRTHLLDRCRVPGFLDQPVEHVACKNNRELLAHLVWHWSYHSGQIGLIAMEAGFDYVWVSTLRS